MGYKDITDGNKIGKAIHPARFIRAEKTGTVGIEVAFQFNEGDSVERLNWIGWLSEKAIDNTMKTLVDVLEFNGNDEINADSTLKDPKALNYGSEVSLVVRLEEYEGKKHPKIAFVNQLGGSAFEACTPETVKNTLGAIGFKAAYLAKKQGSKAETIQSKSPLMRPMTTQPDVGF